MISADVLEGRIRRALGPLNDTEQSVDLLAGSAATFIEWLFSESCEALEICPADVMDKLATLGLAEWRDVDPSSNEYEADRLCYLVGAEKPPTAAELEADHADFTVGAAGVEHETDTD